MVIGLEDVCFMVCVEWVVIVEVKGSDKRRECEFVSVSNVID